MTKARRKNAIHPWNETLGDIDQREFGNGRIGTPLKGQRELGVEVECEGANLPMVNFGGWDVHMDGSLRQHRPGDNCCEYVFHQPESRGDSYIMIDKLDMAFNEHRVDLYEDSPRTSVHVHVNQRGLTLKQICNQVTMYLVFEELLSEYCGKRRMGNLFCLRACDSESIIEELILALRSGSWRRVADEHMRYAGMNLASLFKFGTIEYRTMRCTRDFGAIKKWIDILCRLKDKALEFENPQRIVEQVSLVGARQFVADTLGVHAMLVMGSVNFDRVLMDGVRTAQDLAYAVSWEANPTKVPSGWTGGNTEFVERDEHDDAVELAPQPARRPMPLGRQARPFAPPIQDFGWDAPRDGNLDARVVLNEMVANARRRLDGEDL